MVQGGVDGVEMTHFLHPHDQEGTEGWTWLDDGTEERRTAVAKACLTLRNPSRSTPASDSYRDGLKRG